MQSLYHLVHALAKEEKRLYNLHGRKTRFTAIYEGYLAAAEYDKQLDRDIYANHFASFSKAFYSMQKNALLDDLLAVLLEYSNSSQAEYVLSRVRGKYEILIYKGFYDLAANYIKDAISAAQKAGNLNDYLRVLEDYTTILTHSPEPNWEEYEKLKIEIDRCRDSLEMTRPIEEYVRQLKILTKNATNDASKMEEFREIALQILEDIHTQTNGRKDAETGRIIFEAEYLFSKTFEDTLELHRRLVNFEKTLNNPNYPVELRLGIVNRLMESSLECGDFLLISGIIYKTSKDIRSYSPDYLKAFLPTFLELSAIYHFYENDLTTSQVELAELLNLEYIDTETSIRNFYNLIAVQVAANLARSARETLRKMQEKHASQAEELDCKLLALIIGVEMNEREEGLSQVQRIQSFLRKQDSPRKLGHYKLFSEAVQKMLERKQVSWEEIPGLRTDWRELLKLNLWLKAKIENAFYYNNILGYWQARKKVLNV